jgi:hypothetical protein
MSKVFIGGSRHISRLSAAVRERLDRIIDKGLPVLLGDANGVDKAVQRYLQDRGYRNVEIFCAHGECRNNLGNWPLRSVKPTTTRKDFNYFAEKDRLMAREANYGLMVWDGKSLGTLLNVSRLARQHKTVVVYTASNKQFKEIRAEADFARFLYHCSDDVRRRALRQLEQEEDGTKLLQQVGLF